MQQLKYNLLWVLQCLMNGYIVPRKKQIVLRQTFTENVWFKKRLKNIVRFAKQEVVNG
jgi:hypothetical protein